MKRWQLVTVVLVAGVLIGIAILVFYHPPGITATILVYVTNQHGGDIHFVVNVDGLYETEGNCADQQTTSVTILVTFPGSQQTAEKVVTVIVEDAVRPQAVTVSNGGTYSLYYTIY
jgi:hypothetical protein